MAKGLFGQLAPPRTRPWFWRAPIVAVMAVVCIGATFAAGQEMARWRLHRLNALDDAFAVSDDAPYELRRKAAVAMQREARRSIERLRLLARDGDQRLATHVQNLLKSVEESLR